MPWKPSDAQKHTRRACTKAGKEEWAKIANKVLKESGDEGKAIRIANAAVAKRHEKC
jgi:hypothetical protein